MPTFSPEVLSRLRTFDTPTICNLIELFEIRPRTEGYMDARIKACFPDMPPVVGFAATATLRASSPARNGAEYDNIQAQIESFGELSGPAFVVVEDLDDPAVAATFGDLVCNTYAAFGAVGLITSGSVRDLGQVLSLNFPVFASGVCCSHGYSHIVRIGHSVIVGGVTVRPDDLIHADGSGVTTIPMEIAAEVADAGYEYVAAEAVVLDALRGEGVTPQLHAEARREATARMERLRQQVSRAQK